MTTWHHLLTPDTRVVVLDLDGTFYLKSRMVLRMLLAAPLDVRRMLAERRTRRLLRGRWLETKDQFDSAFFSTLAREMNSSPEEAVHWYMERYMPRMVAVIRQHYKLVDWVSPLMGYCKDHGIAMVVLSDYGHAVEKLEALGVDVDALDWVVSAMELGGLKPAKELLEVISERMDVRPSEILVIGDREDTDGDLARAVGATYWRCNSGDRR